MIKNETDLINYILKNINNVSPRIKKSIGDDCAVLKISKDGYLVFTTDTSLLGPHFSSDYSPMEIGYKCLASNLSDIAAMGCKPKYLLMAITIPSLDEKWLKGFYGGINSLVRKYKLALIGGDINKGPLSISFQVIGESTTNVLFRDGAKTGDDIYVSGNIGLARAALIFEKKRQKKNYNSFKNYLRKPNPRIELGLELSKFASSCIDISDGLAKDLSSILIQSNKGASIVFEDIPTSRRIKNLLSTKELYESLLGGGEDYELCFTSNKKYTKKISSISKKLNIKLTKIGEVKGKKLRYYNDGVEIHPNFQGFDHFQS